MKKTLKENTIRFIGFGGKIKAPKDVTQKVIFLYNEGSEVKSGQVSVDLIKGDTPSKAIEKAIAAANKFLSE